MGDVAIRISTKTEAVDSTTTRHYAGCESARRPTGSRRAVVSHLEWQKEMKSDPPRYLLPFGCKDLVDAAKFHDSFPDLTLDDAKMAEAWNRWCAHVATSLQSSELNRTETPYEDIFPWLHSFLNRKELTAFSSRVEQDPDSIALLEGRLKELGLTVKSSQ